MNNTLTLALPEGATGVPTLAWQLGIPAHTLRRELLLMSQFQWATFAWSGRVWLVTERQLPLVEAWLKKRGLLPQAEQGETGSV